MKRKMIYILMVMLSVSLFCINDKQDGEALQDGEANIPQMSKDIAVLINNHRSGVGCGTLTFNNAVYKVALAHSQDMSDNNYFDHNNLSGQTPFDRLQAAGVTYSTAGENIARGYTSASAVVNGWLNSSGHRANIENCNFTEHGIGYVESGRYYTHVFIKPR